MVELPTYVAILCEQSAAAGVLERVTDAKRLKAHKFQAAFGLLRDTGVEVVVAIADEKSDALGAVASAIRRVHSPELLIGAGFSCAISEELETGQVVLAERVVTASGQAFGFKQRLIENTWAVGTLVDARAEESEEGASAANLWCGPVAQACAEVVIPSAIVTVVDRRVSDEPDAELEAVKRQATAAGKAGAILRAVWNRPKSVLDLASDKAASWEHQETLADAVTKLVQIAERDQGSFGPS